MSRAELLQFLRTQRWAIETSVSELGFPQAALVGVVVTDVFEIVFDARDTTRKIVNLRARPNIAFVLGGWSDGDERTVQYEGVADEPSGPELERLKATYFERFPDGRERASWPGLVYVRARPRWIRYSDFNRTPPEIVVFEF